ncbi:unnamed protein product [Brassica oleracea var. botrytis]
MKIRRVDTCLPSLEIWLMRVVTMLYLSTWMINLTRKRWLALMCVLINLENLNGCLVHLPRLL